MDIEQLTEIGNGHPAVTTDIKWEDHLCFNVGGKVFFILSLENVPTTASFKVDADDFDSLIDQDGLSPAPYLGRYKWAAIDDIGRFNEQQWKHYVGRSYALIADKLPKRLKTELGI